MSTDSMLALMGFAFVMSITPGPSNLLLLASGVNFGFVRSLPLICGISAGFLAMVFCVGIGLGTALEAHPFAQTVLKLACAGYVFWLAWKIGRTRALGAAAGGRADRPVSFVQAALLQLVNPKAWAVALIAAVSYTEPESGVAGLVLMILVFAAVNLPSISVWAISGVALRRALGEGRRIALFNLAMAAVLVGSMIPVLLGALQ